MSVRMYINTRYIMSYLRISTRLRCEKIQQSQIVQVLFITSFWPQSTCANVTMPLSVPLQRRYEYIHTAVLVVEPKGCVRCRGVSSRAGWPPPNRIGHSTQTELELLFISFWQFDLKPQKNPKQVISTKAG